MQVLEMKKEEPIQKKEEPIQPHLTQNSSEILQTLSTKPTVNESISIHY